MPGAGAPFGPPLHPTGSGGSGNMGLEPKIFKLSTEVDKLALLEKSQQCMTLACIFHIQRYEAARTYRENDLYFEVTCVAE